MLSRYGDLIETAPWNPVARRPIEFGDAAGSAAPGRFRACFAALMAMPSALELREFLDANVPDGADDYSYADRLLVNIEVAARIDVPPGET